MSRLSSSNKLRRIALIAVFGALAYVLMLVVHFKVSFLTKRLFSVIIISFTKPMRGRVKKYKAF